MLAFYELQLVLLIASCAVWLLFDNQLSKIKTTDAAERHSSVSSGKARARLTRQYLMVYGIVMGADWLQGPYVYSLYREQYRFPERLVAVLFVTGFVSAGFMAPFVGVWADQYGRKRLCMVFCVTYTLSCLCILIPYLPMLLIGRLLGGISTSILYSAFESWLISSSNNLGLPQSDLSAILGRATLLNGFVATGAGVFSNQLVKYSYTFSSPFVASGVLLVLAWVTIKGTWTENYGSPDSGAKNSVAGASQVQRLFQAISIVKNDPYLIVLGLTQTCFEGSMYLFVFIWVPSLQEATSLSSLPLGFIFSCFMLSMMLGSLLYTSITTIFSSSSSSSNNSSVNEEPLVLHAKLSSLVCAVSALAFSVAVASKGGEHTRFWAFCAFEACVGMYYPVQGMLRGSLVSNEHRATLSSLFRVPLNIFVVVSILTGVSDAREKVLVVSAVMLGLSSVLTGVVIVNGLANRKIADTAVRMA